MDDSFFPNSSNFSEVVRSLTFFKALMSNLFVNKFKLEKDLACGVFQTTSEDDKNLQSKRSSTELAAGPG